MAFFYKAFSPASLAAWAVALGIGYMTFLKPKPKPMTSAEINVYNDNRKASATTSDGQADRGE
jgi:hypothetical protein